MKVRKLIEILAKLDWNAKIKIDDRDREQRQEFSNKEVFEIKSVSSFQHKGKPIVTLNIND